MLSASVLWYLLPIFKISQKYQHQILRHSRLIIRVLGWSESHAVTYCNAKFWISHYLKCDFRFLGLKWTSGKVKSDSSLNTLWAQDTDYTDALPEVYQVLVYIKSRAVCAGVLWISMRWFKRIIWKEERRWILRWICTLVVYQRKMDRKRARKGEKNREETEEEWVR